MKRRKDRSGKLRATIESQLEAADTIRHDRQLDPFSLGACCTCRPTQALDPLRATDRWVHFASADSALGWRGFVDDAIASRINAGRAVAKQLMS